MKNYKFTAVIWRDDVAYVSKCPELGVASAGDTEEEALENLKDAIGLYLENAKELGILEDIQPAITAEKLTSAISHTFRD